MEYVFVGSWKQPKEGTLNYTLPSIRQAGNILISLIDTLQKGNFHLGSTDNFKKEITNLKSQLTTQKLYLDSGGYSVIVGDVPGKDVVKFLDNYDHCSEFCKDIYDYIFSLDIPIFLNEQQYNNKLEITKFNRMSMATLKNRLTINQDIRDKALYVWQFKIQDQYDIWSTLYDELKMAEVVKHRAIGGMVGLRGITQINFSPFIGPMYRCLRDYVEVANGEYKLKIHNLGVYIQHDRFFLILMEKLFNLYLKRDDTEITYDSVNYMRTAQLRAKKLNIYSFHDGKRVQIIEHLKLPDEILKEIYDTPDLFYGVKEEIKRCPTGNLSNIDAFTPMNVYSNVQLDKFFNYIIDRYDFVKASLDPNKWITPLIQIGSAFPEIFSPRRITSLTENFQHLYNFQHWFLRDKSYTGFAPIMDNFIKQIKFPAHLEDVFTHPGSKDYDGGITDED